MYGHAARWGGDPDLRLTHPPRIVAVGGGESAEFQRQSCAYMEHCVAAGIAAEPLVLDGDDHFDAVLELTDPASALTRALVEMVHAC